MTFRQVCVAAVLPALAAIAQAPAHATETDSFTHRRIEADALPMLNARMNGTLSKATAGVTSCSEAELHAAVFARLGGFVVAKIERWAEKVPGSLRTPFGRSIYRGLWNEAFALGPGCCAPQFRLGSTLLGGDKLGHFLHSGYEMYFVVRSLSDRPLRDARGWPVRALDVWASPIHGAVVESALGRVGLPRAPIAGFELTLLAERLVAELGHAQEDGGWGLKLTGVKSYGDITANLEGFRFWKQLTAGDSPYFTCEEGRWRLARSFDWSEYVSDGWDEAINCNSYVSKRMSKTIAGRVAKLAREEGWPSTTCPIDPGRCGPLVRRYGELAARLLHPDCLQMR